MSVNWTEYRLGDITDWYSGGTPSKLNKHFWDGEIPWISASSMYGNRFNSSDNKITQLGVKNGSRLVPENTVLILVRGSSLHQRLPIGITTREVAFNQDVKAIIPKEKFKDVLDPWYLLFWFISNEKLILQKVEETGIGAGKLDLKVLQDLVIRIPDKQTKLDIIHVFKTIDDKIIINNRINQTLETIAQTLFKSWFVGFDPVKAKIAAKEQGEDPQLAAMTAISGKTADEIQQMPADKRKELADTADLFPDEMMESELGGIPKGWKASNFGNVINCFDSKRIPLSSREREKIKGDYPYYGATSLMDYVDKYIFDGTYLLLGEDGSVIKDSGLPYTQFVWGKFWVNNHAHVLQGKNSVSTEQLYIFISQTNISEFITGAVQLKLNQGNMNRIPFILAPKTINDSFNNIVNPLMRTYKALFEQKKRLSELRDTLLPKLLSGEIAIN